MKHQLANGYRYFTHLSKSNNRSRSKLATNDASLGSEIIKKIKKMANFLKMMANQEAMQTDANYLTIFK